MFILAKRWRDLKRIFKQEQQTFYFGGLNHEI